MAAAAVTSAAHHYCTNISKLKFRGRVSTNVPKTGTKKVVYYIDYQPISSHFSYVIDQSDSKYIDAFTIRILQQPIIIVLTTITGLSYFTGTIKGR